MSRIPLLLTLLCFAILAALTAAADLADDKPAKGDESSSNDKSFHERLREIAKTYTKFGRVDDEMRWAPTLCDLPHPPVARVSQSKDKDGHGQKLYSIFAQEPRGYVHVARMDAKDSVPVGQVIVKQSWLPEEVTDPQEAKKAALLTPRQPSARVRFDGTRDIVPDRKDSFVPYVYKGEKLYKAGKQGELFIMVKMDAKTPNTDAGWVYGTIAPDAQTVSSAGRVENCMGCHTKAKHDRLFGLPAAAAKAEK